MNDRLEDNLTTYHDQLKQDARAGRSRLMSRLRNEPAPAPQGWTAMAIMNWTVTALATAATVAIIVTAMSVSMDRPASGMPGDAWYYDTVTGEYFTDATTKVSPFQRGNGNEAVWAHFFTCGQCTDKLVDEGGERFIGYYEKYTDEVKKKLESAPESFMIYEMAFMGRLYSKDGRTWVEGDKPDGVSITSELQRHCPPKKLRYCPPR